MGRRLITFECAGRTGAGRSAPQEREMENRCSEPEYQKAFAEDEIGKIPSGRVHLGISTYR